jgi:hypothetical protein
MRIADAAVKSRYMQLEMLFKGIGDVIMALY